MKRSFTRSLAVKRQKKKGVFQLKDLPDKAQNMWRKKVCQFCDLWKNINCFEIYIKFAFLMVVLLS